MRVSSITLIFLLSGRLSQGIREKVGHVDFEQAIAILDDLD